MKISGRGVFCGIALLLAAGCVSPYAGRERQINRRQYSKVREGAREDLEVLGQFKTRGSMAGKVSSSTKNYDTRYLHYAELAHGVIPFAYYDMARANLAAHRYTDAIRCAKNAIDQGSWYYREDKWTMHRMPNLMNNLKILYESYLYLGDLQSSSAAYKQFLILSKIAGTKIFKNVVANSLKFRMHSMKVLSDYRAAQHWENVKIILILAASGAGSYVAIDSGNIGSAVAIAAAGAMLASQVAAYKVELKAEHNVELAQLLTAAEAVNNLPPPSAEDVRRAKMASRLYPLAGARDVSTYLDTSGIMGLRKTMEDIVGGVAVRYKEGKWHVRGNLAALIAASERIDEIPLSLPPPPEDGVDDYLDKYLTSDLYRVAGLKMTGVEAGYFRKILKEGETEYTFDPTAPETLVIINGIRRAMQKGKAFDRWAAAL